MIGYGNSMFLATNGILARSASGGSNIVTAGLVLNLDAGNTASYSGTGTTWTDLTGNGYNGTLVNGVGYSSLNGGSLSFDGTDDIVNLSNVATTNTFTLNMWIYPIPSSDVYGALFTQASFAGIFYLGGSKKITYYTTPTDRVTTAVLIENRWNNVVIINNGGNVSFYINSALDASTFSSVNGFTAGMIGNDNFSENFKGNISIINLYNRVLSSTEILQNYNAIRSRYGL